jgi:8-oxo-dGTP pyrophosphatase MutT (NUDIX family)
MTTPVTPSPAATLVLLRDRPDGQVETLLIRRHSDSKFAAGDYVFAGGKVERDDMPADAERFCHGLGAGEASARLGGDLAPREALSFWVGAIREAFEEVGLLLAYEGPDAFVRLTADRHDRYAAYRRACHAANAAFFEMLRAESLILATDRLAYFAHWITPEENPIRFDTRFFAAVAPAGQAPEADGKEIVDVRWLTPAEALAAQQRKEISLRLPTMKNLDLLRRSGTASEVVASLRAVDVRTVRPRLLTIDGKIVPVLPGDPRWY